MLGPTKPRRLDEPIAVSLEGLVPASHSCRHLEAKLDLSFVREWTRKFYAERGRPSIDPVIFFKLQLVMFFEGIRSKLQLIETASLNLAHRWYLGYALDEDLRDHSSLTRIRQRLGIDILQRFFEQVVDLCQDARLVWVQELFCYATRVAANAILDSLVPRFYHEAKCHVADLFTNDPVPTDGYAGDGADPLPCDALLHLPVYGRPSEDRPNRSWHLVGSCWRNGGWTRTGPRSAPTNAQVTCASVPPIPTPRPCALEPGLAWATTITTSSTAGDRASSWRR
jgi:transposase